VKRFGVDAVMKADAQIAARAKRGGAARHGRAKT
jgi:hypothetical protein